jgi:adenylate kinase family enzyme
METLEKRIKSYENETIPMLNRISNKSHILKIDGTSTVNQIHDRILKGIKYLI